MAGRGEHVDVEEPDMAAAGCEGHEDNKHFITICFPQAVTQSPCVFGPLYLALTTYLFVTGL